MVDLWGVTNIFCRIGFLVIIGGSNSWCSEYYLTMLNRKVIHNPVWIENFLKIEYESNVHS